MALKPIVSFSGAFKNRLPQAGGGHIAETYEDVNPPWQTTAFFICGSSAYSLYLAWFFSILLHFGAPFGFADETNSNYLFPMSFLGALALSMVFAWLFSDSLSSKGGTLLLVAGGSLFSIVSPICSWCGLALPVLFGCWFLSGIGCACIMILSTAYLASLNHHDVLLCTPTCFALAAILAFLIAFLSPESMQVVVLTILPVSASLLFLHVHSRYLSIYAPTIKVRESRGKNPMSWKSMGAAGGNSMCLGFAVYCTVMIAGRCSIWGIATACLTVFAISVLMALDGYTRKELLNSEGIQLKLFLPFAALGLLPMPFMDATGKIVCCCILFLAFIPQAITNINAVAENVRLYGLAPVRSFAGSRVVNIVGLAIGNTMGFFAYGRGLGQGASNSLIVLLVLLFVLIVLAAFLFKDRYPSEAAVRNDYSHDDGHLSWKMRCNILAKRIGLSPRQSEVLLLLSRGHNTKYIEEQLVISNHTAKSHIYSIYQKAGVHSKQEIIEMIENIKADQR